jgi:hypothetical protein
MSPVRATAASLFIVMATAATADAQFLGTFRWQLQPYCNVVSLGVTQNGGTYRIEGTDDQCGAGAHLASAIGTAFPNPDGSIGLGVNIIVAPGGAAVHVDATVSLATLNGTWRDSAGHAGTFTFTPGPGIGGSPRPVPASGSVIPANFGLLSDGGFLARGTFGASVIPAGNIGTRMMWYPGKAAFRAGEVVNPVWDDVNIGAHSVALGFNTLASGSSSTAFGTGTGATGQSSTAMGEDAQATGPYATAIGYSTRAGGNASIAMGAYGIANGAVSTATGFHTTANGSYSLATGHNTSATGTASAAFGQESVAAGIGSFAAGFQGFANGDYSVALGTRVFAGGGGSVVLGSDAVANAASAGSFIFGDRSTETDIISSAPNQFNVRAAGGYGFYTNAALTTGIELHSNASQWSFLSDVNSKELFRDLDHEDLLAKLARLPVQEWSYKAQGASIRHVGPTAQDFRAAFGLGEDEIRIGSLDLDGINLAMAKALEARTRDLMRENEELRARLDRLERELAKR